MHDTLSTLSVRRRRRRSSHGPHLHGFPLAPLGYHPRLSMVRLRRRRLCVKVGEAESEEYPQDHTRGARVEIGDMREVSARPYTRRENGNRQYKKIRVPTRPYTMRRWRTAI